MKAGDAVAKGIAEIEQLLSRRELERVAPSRDQADAWLAQARANVGSASVIMHDNPTAGYVLSYDAARLGIAAMLVNQGLRATTTGGHIAVFAAAVAQLGDAARPFARMRRRRNELEYPSTDTVGAAVDDVEEVLDPITRFLASIDTVLDEMGVF